MFKRLYLFRHECEMKKLIKTGIQVGRDTLLFNETQNYGGNPEMVAIGNHCVITAGVQFITNPGILKACSNQDESCENRNSNNRIIIHDNCFIGIDAIIYPNVVIGPNAIVGAGSVVMSDVPSDMCVRGNPSRAACTVEFYASTCKRGMMPNYVPEIKRRLLQKYFWNI